MSEPTLGPEGIRRFVSQVMEMWVLPEVRRRQEAGELPKPFGLRAAQVVFDPDRQRPVVRLNEEVRALADMRLKHGIQRGVGEPVMLGEIEEIRDMQLCQEEDKDCGHITLVLQGNHGTISFDARMNKDLARRHIAVARDFLETARTCLAQRKWAPFADTLFSAAELLAKATLLSVAARELRKKETHRRIHTKLNWWARLGNVDQRFKETFNKLAGLRPGARYLKSDFSLPEKEAEELLATVQEMASEAERSYEQSETSSPTD